jgi:hypothetical protein
MSNATYTLELGGKTLRVHYSYRPGDPGRTSGPPERCYPPEPEELEISSILLRGEPPLEMIHNPRFQRYHWIDATELLWLACGKDASAEFYLSLEAKILDFIHDEEDPEEP